MPHRATLPMRFRFSGDEQLARRWMPFARVLMGSLLERIANGNLTQLRRFCRIPGGSIEVQFDGSIASAIIDIDPQAQETLEAHVARVWVPRGIVCFPGNEDHINGWGLPAAISEGERYADASLAPGLDTANWHDAGPLGEVLLTKQADAGYPLRTREPMPLFMEDAEFTTVRTGTPTLDGIVASGAGPYAAFRLEFADFIDFDTGAADTLRRSAWETLRATFDFTIQLPLRGYYDAATRLADYAGAFGTPGTGTQYDVADYDYPAGYQLASERAAKDGLHTNALDVLLDSGDPAPAAPPYAGAPLQTAVNVGVALGRIAYQLTEHEQWIRCGNRRWIPTNAAMPIVSWDGHDTSFLTNNFSAYRQLDNTLYPLDAFARSSRGRYKAAHSRSIYARGRKIAEAPKPVLAVGVRAVDGFDRIIAICHDSNDQHQPVGANDTLYFQFVRIYFADVPRRFESPLFPRAPIVGDYDPATNPTGWKFVGVVDTTPPGDASWSPESPLNGAVMVTYPVFNGDASNFAYGVVEFGAFASNLATIEHQDFDVAVGLFSPGTVSYVSEFDWAIRDLPTFDAGQTTQLSALDYNAAGVLEMVVTAFSDTEGHTGYFVWWSGTPAVEMARIPTGTFVFGLSARDGIVILMSQTNFCTVLGDYLGARSYTLKTFYNGAQVGADKVYEDTYNLAIDTFQLLVGGGNANAVTPLFDFGFIDMGYAVARDGDAWIVSYLLCGKANLWAVIDNPAVLCTYGTPTLSNLAADAYLGGATESSFDDINTLVGVEADELTLVPMGIV